MIRGILFITMLLFASGISAQLPPNPDHHYAGIYADQPRLFDCIGGPAGSGFEQFIWAWIPHTSGLSYITLRFLFWDTQVSQAIVGILLLAFGILMGYVLAKIPKRGKGGIPCL